MKKNYATLLLRICETSGRQTARIRQSCDNILKNVPGSDHGKRKYRISDKIQFDSEIVYDSSKISRRWGISSESILRLCDKTTKIPNYKRRGIGKVMGNLIFYHSVPNNIPGMLFSANKGWNPLFPNRAIPQWTIDLIEKSGHKKTYDSSSDKFKIRLPRDTYELLLNIKKGIRTKAGLSRRMDCDIQIIYQLVDECIRIGFITDVMRLTPPAYDHLKNWKVKDNLYEKRDFSLYVPKSWCVDRGTAQPSVPEKIQTDSTGTYFVDGDDGQSSLERTDAIAPTSPICVIPQCPSVSRECDNAIGPKRPLKEPVNGKLVDTSFFYRSIKRIKSSISVGYAKVCNFFKF